MSVKLSGFTPTTYDFVAALIEEWFGHPKLSFTRPTVIPIGSACEAYFRLREVDDASFPGSKWATLQHLETLITDALCVPPLEGEHVG